MTPDPIGLEGGNNLFVYGDNNSINSIDPKGLNVVVYPTPYGPVAIVLPPPPVVTYTGRGKLFIPPNLPNFNPDPGDKFRLCMEVCKKALEVTKKCPKFVAKIPCAILCAIAAFHPDGNNDF